jgi:hypothetical protein
MCFSLSLSRIKCVTRFVAVRVCWIGVPSYGALDPCPLMPPLDPPLRPDEYQMMERVR